MAAKQSNLEKIRLDRDRLLSEGKFYEALQLYNTMLNRCLRMKAYSDCISLCLDGSLNLLYHGSYNSAYELALGLLNCYQRANIQPDLQHIVYVFAILCSFPSSPSTSSLSTPASPASITAKINFIKAAIKWCSSVAPRDSFNALPDLHLALARTYREQQDLSNAHLEYVRSGGSSFIAAFTLLTSNPFLVPCSCSSPSQDSSSSVSIVHLYPIVSPAVLEAARKLFVQNKHYKEHADLIRVWSEQGTREEQDLFVTRAVLQYLCVNDGHGAQAIIQHALTNQHSTDLKESPLIHFAQFLVECARVGVSVAPLFDVLRHKYALCVSRDPSFTAYLDRIASNFFGKQLAKGLLDGIN